MLTLLRGLLNLLRLPLLPLWWVGRAIGRPRAPWLLVRVHQRLAELERPRSALLRWVPGLVQLLPTPLEVLRRLAQHIVRDGRVRGVVFELPHLTAGWATSKSLRDVMTTLRQGGKEVVVYLPRGGGNREVYVASAADRIFVGPESSVMALGLSLEGRYIKPLLDKVGVSVEAFAHGEYKTAAEAATRESMSEAQREQLQGLLAAMDRELVSALASRPGLDEGRVRGLFEQGFLRGREAVEAGLADGVCYEDELPNVVGSGEQPERMGRAPRYYAFKEGRFFGQLVPSPYIAVVPVRGAITEHASRPGATGASLEQVVTAIRSAGEDRRALGVVLHVSSPGGSATASDLIHREVVRLADQKPVVACFGEVAASGGYYVAAGAHRIVAQPVTITGSIGVVSAKVLARTLLERIGVRTETLRTAPHADMLSPTRELEQAEREILERQLDGFYRGFVDVVARGRGKSFEEIERVARGRVWSGADALEQGLVDRLGGLDAALDEVRSKLGVADRVARRLRPRLVVPKRTELNPPEPRKAPADSLATVALQRLAPQAWELLELVSGPDRFLYYAPALPIVD